MFFDFNTDELRSIEQTTNKLVDVAMSLSDKNSRDRTNAVMLSSLVSELRMVAFIADVANNFLEPTTALPVQIYLWSDLQEQGFVEKTALAILLMLGVLMMFNLGAIILRKKFEKKW